MAIAHINIGSNLGNRMANILRAVAEITLLSDTPVKKSTIIESAPWGYKSQHSFINIGIEISITLTPEQLIRELQKIEKSISPSPHRTPDGTYADRPIDIDLIYVDQQVISTPQLSIPHPRMHLRSFVLTPIAEIAPEWTHPTLKLTATQMLAQIHNKM